MLPNGTEVRLECIKHPGAAAIIPFLSEKEIILIRQYRPVVDKYIWEIPAGTLRRGESPLRCARRELEEDEYITACPEACPAQAVTFGDLNNPDHRVSKLAKSENAFRLLEKLNTKPKEYYLSSKDWVRKFANAYSPEQFKLETKKDI